MVHTHVDVLGIERCNHHLVLGSLLLYEWLTLRYRHQVLRRLVLLRKQFREFLLTHRTVVQHLVLLGTQVTQQVQQRLWISLTQLLFGHVVTTHVVRTVNTI